MSLINNTNNIFMKGVIGMRQAQEDSHDMKLKTPNGDVFVVCDGMGGHVGGAKASSLAVESIIDHLNAERYANPLEALDGALQFANMQILGFADDHPEYKGMGTTACVVLLQGDKAYIAHVGDSRIYLYLGKEKELHRITKDHSYVQTLVDKGIMSDDQAEKDPNKNRILKALGVNPNLEPTYNTVKPKNEDIFLICSDGLCGMIPDSTIEKALGQKVSLEERGEMLIQLAMQGETVQPGGQDNCTLELIQIDNSPWQRSVFTSHNPAKPGKKKDKNQGKKGFPKIIKIILIVLALIVALGAAGAYIYKGAKDIKRMKSETSGIESQADSVQTQTDKTKSETKDLQSSASSTSNVSKTNIKSK